MKTLLVAISLATLGQAQSTLVQSWAGDVGTYTGTTPTYADRPDNGLAVGPTQVVQLTGQDFAIWAKSGGAQSQKISTKTFLSNASAGFTSSCWDPRIYFDPFIGVGGRFVAMCTDSGSGIDSFCVSGSTDATSGSTANWKCSTVPNSGQRDDTLRMGFDKNGSVICRFQSGTQYNCYAFTNTALAWTGSSGPGTYAGSAANLPYEINPAIDLNPNKASNAPNVMIGRTGPPQTGTNVALNLLAVQLSWSGSTPTFSSTTTIATPSWLYNTPINGSQPGSPSAYSLEESHRVFPPTWDQNGKVWVAIGSGPCASSCGSLPSNGHTGFYWAQIDPVTLAISQSGLQFTANSLSFQSVVTDSNNVTHIITQYSNSSNYISLAEYYRLPTDAAGTLRGPYMLASGSATYTQGCGGDSPGKGVSYNTAVLDYYNQGTVWATGELGTSSTPCKWATQVMQLSYGGVSVVGVTMSPSSVTLTNLETQSFTATVTGSTNTAVTWSLSPQVGTLSVTGSTAVYTAPSNISANQSVQLVAASAADPTKSASATISLIPTVQITVSPTAALLTAGQTKQFTATVTGTTNTAVQWSLNPQVGTISSTGLYTAPATISAAQTVTVLATSQANTQNSAMAQVSLATGKSGVGVTMSPTSVTLTNSQTQSFTATVTGSTNTAVTWSLSPQVGTLSVTGSTAVYTAPSNISANQSVQLVATSAADPTKAASATISLAPTVQITVSPTAALLTAGQTKQFTATVTGTTNTAVQWSLNPQVGTISSTGLYTAPATISAAQTVTVLATSQADTQKTAMAQVSLVGPSVGVTMSPTSVTLTNSQTQSFTATVTGSTNTAVTWSLSPQVGTLSVTGSTAVYTVPGTLATNQSVQIVATSAADPTKSASAAISLIPTVQITVSPTAALLTAGQTKQFTATVTGTTNTAVQWSLNPQVGTISSAGLYTAPATISAAQTVTVLATSQANTQKTATAQVSLVGPSVGVTMSPTSVTLTNSQTQAFTATVTGSTNTAVTWSLSPQVGTLSVTGSTAVYTVPGTLATNQNVQVVATSVADPTKSASAAISLVPTVQITVSPTTISLSAGQTQQFVAIVTGAANTAVLWSVNPQVGTISSSGLYTAPTSILVGQMVTVTAAAQANTQKTAVAQVSLQGAQGITFTVGSKGLNSVVYNGVNYNYTYGEELLTSATIQTPSGPVFTYAPPCTTSSTSTSVSSNCQFGADSASVTARYSTRGQDTLCEDLTVSNTSTADNINSLTISAMGFQMQQFNATNSRLQNVGRGNPASWVSYVNGQYALWADTPSNDATLSMTPCGVLGQNGMYLCKQQPMISNITAGQTKTTRFCARFTPNLTILPVDLVPEAYANYRAAFPQVTEWPDRRPVYAWFISDGTHRSATNPRGYFNNAALNVSNLAAFARLADTNAQTVLAQMNSRPVRPQGIVVWDIEGQEFNQPTSFIGDPRVLGQGYSPEMNAAADQLFARFTNAGYRVGVTLRPQYLQWGTTLPATCHYSPDNNLKDYFILVNAPYQQTFNACYDPLGLTWSVIPVGNGAQTTYVPGQESQVLALLLSKAQYAHNRWGATLFYVDSSVWEGGTPISADIFRSLQQAMPDSLFMPEESTMDTFSGAIPYTDPDVPSLAKYSPLSYRWVYPTGAMAASLQNCAGNPTCWSSSLQTLEIGQKIGDIPLYSQPQQLSAAQLNGIESMIQTARNQNSSVVVTDTSTGAQTTFAGRPSTVYNYPLKMRVYFAASAGQLATSATYCEAGQWQGTNTCTMSLAGMTVYQVQYYDFTDHYVTAESPVAFP